MDSRAQEFYRAALLSPAEVTRFERGAWPDPAQLGSITAAESSAGITDKCDVAFVVPFCKLEHLSGLFPDVHFRRFEAATELYSTTIVRGSAWK